MPHKRAKRPARERQRAQRPTDLAPKITVEHEPVPKSVSRVLHATQIRREYRERKRTVEGVGCSDEGGGPHKKTRQDADEAGNGTALAIRPGETMAQFHRRVEHSMMPRVTSALRQASAQARRVRREAAAQQSPKRGKHGGKAHPPVPGRSQKGPDPPPTADDGADSGVMGPGNPVKEFQAASTGVPRRLNDIAREPPVLKRLPRGATKNDAGPSGVLSMAQKAMMDEEREKIIRHYRELKARKARERGGDGGLNGSHTKGPP